MHSMRDPKSMSVRILMNGTRPATHFYGSYSMWKCSSFARKKTRNQGSPSTTVSPAAWSFSDVATSPPYGTKHALLSAASPPRHALHPWMASTSRFKMPMIKTTGVLLMPEQSSLPPSLSSPSTTKTRSPINTQISFLQPMESPTSLNNRPQHAPPLHILNSQGTP